MNVRCPSCETVYRVDPAKVPEAGVRARCATCSHVIMVRQEVEEPAVATAGVPTAPGRPTAPAIPSRAPAALAPGPRPAPIARPATAAPPTAPSQPQRRDTLAPARPPLRVARPATPSETRPAPPSVPSTPARPSAPVFRSGPGKVVPAPPIPQAPAPPQSPPSAEPPSPAAATQATPDQEATVRPINPFLSQDPRQKARRLARALVSDMIAYQPDKRQQAMQTGDLKEAFAEEIRKSWEEYVEQVGAELANSTTYFTEALNEILAGGQQVF